MDEQHQQLLFAEYYTALSVKTKKPYIDDNNNCYIFDTLIDANNFLKTNNGIEISELELIKSSIFISYLYSLGFDYIQVKKGVAQKYETIPLLKEDVKKKYFNREAIRNILKLKQTLDKQYAKALKDCIFISPVFIEKRAYARYGDIKYFVAKSTSDKQYALLFTDIDDFSKWNEQQQNKSYPLEVNLLREERIRGNNSIIINPLSDKLVLDNEIIKSIIK